LNDPIIVDESDYSDDDNPFNEMLNRRRLEHKAQNASELTVQET